MKNGSKATGAKPVAPKKVTPWPLIFGAGALVLVLLGGVLLLRPAPQQSPGVAPSASGGVPRLVVDQEKLDFGDMSFNQPVVATFRLTNTGEAPLQILGDPVVAVVEGC